MSAENVKPLSQFNEKKQEPFREEQRPVTIMTENDSYIAERMKAQPRDIADIEIKVQDEKPGIHRLSLPDYFEPLSYDCTQGNNCPHHGWRMDKVMYGLEQEMNRWTQTKHGKYIFRWLNKNKRALDHNINVRGWYLVNRSYFSEAPKILFGVNGGIENGDSILGFMSVNQALAIRTKPSKDSLNRVKSETEDKFEGHPNFYKPKLSPDREGVDDAPADALQEGRDFNV